MTVRTRLTGLMGVTVVAALALSGCSSSSHNKSAASSGPASAAASSALPSAPISSPAVAASTPADPAALSAIASAAVAATTSAGSGSTAKPTVKPTPVKTIPAVGAPPTPTPGPTTLKTVAPTVAPTTTATQGAPVPIGSGLTVSLSSVTKTTSTATNCAGTHVFYGPAVQFTLTFSQPTDLSNATLNVAFGSSATPADACDAPTGSGSASTFTYVEGIPKSLPSDQQGTVTIDFYPPNSAKDYQFKNVAVQ
jgi:hypothetical protein